jgi:hypothetical protein
MPLPMELILGCAPLLRQFFKAIFPAFLVGKTVG